MGKKSNLMTNQSHVQWTFFKDTQVAEIKEK